VTGLSCETGTDMLAMGWYGE